MSCFDQLFGCFARLEYVAEVTCLSHDYPSETLGHIEERLGERVQEERDAPVSALDAGCRLGCEGGRLAHVELAGVVDKDAPLGAGGTAGARAGGLRLGGRGPRGSASARL
jgi:hypothetical protein